MADPLTTVDLSRVTQLLDAGWRVEAFFFLNASTQAWLLRNPRARGVDAYRWYRTTLI